MKKILSLLTIAAFTAIVACGPSAEEKAAADKARQDSIDQATAAQMAADSTQRAMDEKHRMDSIAMKNTQDSIAAADSMAAKKAGKPKTAAKPKTTTTTAPGTPQVGHKKPGAK
jgi:hypothetical protein